MHKVNVNVLSGAATGSITGAKIDSNQLMAASFQVVTGDVAVAGTVKIQASNDICNDQYQPDQFTPTNWSDIPSATSTVAAGVGPLITINQLSYRWMRVVFTRTGGTTTINVNMFAIAP